MNHDPNFEKIAAMKQRITDLEAQLASSGLEPGAGIQSTGASKQELQEYETLIRRQAAQIQAYKKVNKQLRQKLATMTDSTDQEKVLDGDLSLAVLPLESSESNRYIVYPGDMTQGPNFTPNNCTVGHRGD